MSDLKPFINKVANGSSLSRAEAEQAFLTMMSGQATPTQIGGFLMSLRVRGESIDEICGAVAAMRRKMIAVDATDNAIDIVGTGGDQSGSYNVSTASAFVVAGAGVTVAKHGNRALSSKSGAADVLKALGVNIDAPPAIISRCIREVGLGFMFAPHHHTAMRHVGPSRVELGTRTIFNLLGPLSNPAGVKKHLIGVYSPEWVEPIAKVLHLSGSEALWIVHGAGMDELTTAGETKVFEIKKGKSRQFTLTPESVGLRRVPFDELRGGDAQCNALALRKVLEGARNAYRDIVLLNSAAAFVIADKSVDLQEGLALAAQSIDSGQANAVLQRLIEVSNGYQHDK